MTELLIAILCLWLLLKVLGLALRVTWCASKIAASVLFALAIPMLICGVIFAGGLLLLIPAAMLGLAFGILNRCV